MNYMARFLTYLTIGPLYLLVFLLPLFFLPFTKEMYEFNKLYLLLGLVMVSFLGWMAKSVFVDRSVEIRITPLSIALLPLALAVLVSTIFSQDVITSLLGYYGRFSSSLTEFFLWLLFYALIINNFTYIESKRLCIPLFASALLLAVIFHLSWMGFLPSISPLGPSAQLLAVFEALTLSLLVMYGALWAKEKWMPWFFGAFVVILSCIVVINFLGSWIILVISLVPFLLWSLHHRLLISSQMNQLSLIVVVAMVAIVLSIFPDITSFFSASDTSRPGSQASMIIAQNVLKGAGSGSLISWIGTGMGNYASAYNLFRTSAFNQSPEWVNRFTVGSSHYLTWIASTGIIGTVTLFFFIGYTLYLLYGVARKKSELQGEGVFYFFGCLAIIVSWGVYYQSFGLSLIFWLLLAMVALFLGHIRGVKQYRYAIGLMPEANLFAMSVFFIMAFVIAGVAYMATLYYQAEVAYALALDASTTSERLRIAQQAAQLNPYRIQYRAVIAQSALTKIIEDVRAAGSKPIKDVTPFQDLAKQARLQADEIVQISPRSVVSWETRAAIYTSMRDLVADDEGKRTTASTALEAFQKARMFEPTNPVLLLQIGSLHMALGDFAKAQEALREGLRLKPDYYELIITQALLLEKQEHLPEAIEKLQALTARIDVATAVLQDAQFHLGRLAYNDNQLSLAIETLSGIVNNNPRHSNAYYILGLSYERLNDKVHARAAYGKALELNPGNEDLMTKIKSLQ